MALAAGNRFGQDGLFRCDLVRIFHSVSESFSHREHDLPELMSTRDNKRRITGWSMQQFRSHDNGATSPNLGP